MVTRQKIAGIMQEFINLESNAEKETGRKARELQEIAGIMQELGSIPNVIPSELVRNAYPIGFIEATLTKDGGSI